MKSKLKLEPKVANQATLKTRLIKYGGGSLAIMSLLGVAMWFYMQIGNQENTMASTGNMAPPNDVKSGAIWLTDLYEDQSAHAAFTNENASSDAVYGTCFNSGADQGVWFKFRALYSDATITVKTGGTLGSIRIIEIALFDTMDNEVACNIASGTGAATITPNTLIQDEWYYLLVNSKTKADTGTFTLYINNVSPVKYYVRKDDDWNKTSTWSTSGYNGSAASSLPSKENVVFIKDADGDITVKNYTAECAGLVMTAGNKKSKLKLKNNGTLKVYGHLHMDNNANKELEINAENATLYVQDSLTLDKRGGSKYAEIDFNNSDLEVEKSFKVTHSNGKSPRIYFDNNSTATIGEDFILSKTGGYNNFDFESKKTDISIGGDMLVEYAGGSGVFYYDFKENANMSVGGDVSFLKKGGSNSLDVYFDDRVNVSVGGNFNYHQINGSGTIYFDFRKNSNLNVSGNMSFLKNGGSNNFQITINDHVNVTSGGNVEVEYASGSSNLAFQVKKYSNFTVGSDMNLKKTGGNNVFDIDFDDHSTVVVNGNFELSQSNGYSNVMFDFKKYSTFSVSGNAQFLKSGGTNNFDIEFDDHSTANIGGNLVAEYSGGSANYYYYFKKTSTLAVGGNMTISKTGGNNNLNVKFDDKVDVDVAGNAYFSLDGGYSQYVFNVSNNTTMDIAGDLTVRETGGTNDFDFIVGTSSSSKNDTLRVGGDFKFGADNGSSSSFKADITVSRSARVELGGDLSALTGKGRLNFSYDQSQLILNGNQQQTIEGESLSGSLIIKYRNVLVNNSYRGVNDTAAAVVINSDVELEEALDLQNGILRMPASAALTFDRYMTLNGGSDSSYIDGKVIKLGSDNMLIPLGDEGVYAPIELKNYSNSSSTNSFSVQYIREPYPDTAVGPGLSHISNIEYWTVEKLSGSSSLKVKIVLHWQNGTAEGISDLNDLVIARYDGTQWVAVQPVSINGSTSQGSIETNYGQGGFGPYTFGSIGGGNVLPIKLNYFNAEAKKDGTVLLSWETAMERNNDFFTLERSYDGQVFEEIATVNGAGNSDAALDYSYVDESPGFGNIYYRLKQTDYDGQYEYFEVRSVFIEAPGDKLEISELYPVPFSNQMTLVINSGKDEPVRIELTSMSGSQIPLRSLSLQPGRNVITLTDLGHLPPGAYILTITSSEKQISKKLLKAQ